MKTDNSSLNKFLEPIIEMFQQEINGLQVVGRALTSAELDRIEVLQHVIDNLRKVLESTSFNSSEDFPNNADNIALRDGRFIAANANLQAELRIDTKQHGIVSMDFYLGTVASGEYLASLRSSPGSLVKHGQRRIDVVGQDDNGNQTSGIIEILPLSETQATVTINLERGISSLPVSTPLTMSATWQSRYFRTIGLEVDFEEGNGGLPKYELDEQQISVESCFGEAGLEIIAAGRRDLIPKKQQGWSDSELHGLMTSFANESLNRQAWLLHLMVLSKSTSRGLLGVMFDSGQLDANGLPRQGVAVFADNIRGHEAGFERKMIQTISHELGHALNLAHRFERTVSRADSLSCMNYDWRYLGGGRQDQFWRDFRFQFDPDEVRFLCHSPRSVMIPGGAEFHTVNYWSDGTGGYSPYYQEVALQGLELSINLPPTGSLFNFAQPVILSAELKNTSGRTLNIPPQFLDPKSGFLEILIRRLTTPNNSDANKQYSFAPLVNRCWDLKDTAADIIPHNTVMRNNINLTFGSSGFTFAEPGNYEVTAVLTLIDQVRKIDQIVRSNTVRIRIAHPQSLEEEKDAMNLFTKEVGFYIALGGSDILSEANDTVKEICDKRQGKNAKIEDPLVAHFTRIEAINLSRDFTTYDTEQGKFKEREAKPEEAVKLLNQLKNTSHQFFDTATQVGLEDLKSNLQKQIKKSG
jgi:hypothetical protein